MYAAGSSFVTLTFPSYLIDFEAVSGGNLEVDFISMLREVATDADHPSVVPVALYQNYPNPFNPLTTIGFRLTEPAHVSLEVFDASGGLVRTLIDGKRGTGEHREVWNGTDGSGRQTASGIYFYRLRVGSFIETRKMVLLR
ncbi:MAG: T9SS type A sorting domain-containing protein [bacterium]|nr:MAG: T9SS type A sorting domain-containing protein [bacterium]